MLNLPLANPFVTTVLEQYPLSNYNDSAPIALGAAGTDRGFACPALSGNLSLSQWVPTYAYEFNDEHAPSFFDRPVSFPLGAYHSAEVLYLLDTHLLNADQLRLSSAWIRYWTICRQRRPNSGCRGGHCLTRRPACRWPLPLGPSPRTDHVFACFRSRVTMPDSMDSAHF
jgi:carboxylesterase type B